jgi:hypothetical protein
MVNSEEQELLQSLGALLDHLPVSGFEERAYRWLLEDFWPDKLARIRRSFRAHVTISFTPSGQLCVDYTGDPASKNRMLLFCHVDREGLVATLGPPVPGPGSRFTRSIHRLEGSMDYVPCMHNQLVCVSSGLGRPVVTRCRFASVKSKGDRVGLLESLPGDDECFREALEDRVAITPTSQAEFEPSTPESLTLLTERSRVLTASALDNAVGVVSASHALRQVISKGRSVNVSVIYTIGEEVGFLGAIAMGMGPPMKAWRNKQLHCVVVDTSSRACSYVVRRAQWRRMLKSGESVEKAYLESADQRFAAVRLCDRGASFSASVSRFLVQAAIGAGGHVDISAAVDSAADPANGASERVLAVGAASGPYSASNGSGSSVADIVARGSPCGLFIGGYCEATILVLADHLRERAGTKEKLWSSCGAIAIPLGNYRGLEIEPSDGKGAMKPEFIVFDSVLHAVDLLVAAAELMAGYSFVSDGLGGSIASVDLDSPQLQLQYSSDEEVIEKLKKWDQRYRDALKEDGRIHSLRRWVNSVGDKLCQSLSKSVVGLRFGSDPPETS